MRHPPIPLLAAAVLLISSAFAFAAEPAAPAKPRAARSVHLNYPVPDASVYYNELTVERTTPGSFYMACGFNHGYFGIQDKAKKVVIFSVWDAAKGNDAAVVPLEQRVEILFKADDVVAKRFGGEGTGGQSFLDYDWQVGQTYCFMVKATPEGKKTTYAAYFRPPDAKAWKHLVTFRTTTARPDSPQAGGDPLRGPHSFVEDFRRDTRSADDVRRASFGNGWVLDLKGEWHAITKAKFSASGATWEAKETIDAGVADGGRFYLQTGGNTKTTNALGKSLERPAGDEKPPEVPKE